MAITSAVCSTFKEELLKGNHDFDGGATYKIALFTSSASMGASTTHSRTPTFASTLIAIIMCVLVLVQALVQMMRVIEYLFN